MANRAQSIGFWPDMTDNISRARATCKDCIKIVFPAGLTFFSRPMVRPKAGADGLIACLRNYFVHFGVPTELFSDGGPEFTAKSTDNFLRICLCIPPSVKWTS